MQKLIIAALAAMHLGTTPSTGAAFENNDRLDPPFIDFGDCVIDRNILGSQQNASVSIRKDGVRYYPNGSLFNQDQLKTLDWISTSVITGCLNAAPGDVINLLQDGANGTYASDNYIGFKFTLTRTRAGFSPATYEYKIGSGSMIIPPRANAGSMQRVNSGTQVTLNGSGSDPDGTIESYSWSWAGGSGDPANAVLSDPNVAQPTFTDSSLDFGDESVTHVFKLTVTDDDGATGAHTVIIIINPPANAAPTANAGSGQTVVSGTQVALDGSGSSDSDGTVESYSWSRIGGTGNAGSITLAGDDTATPTFTDSSLSIGDSNATHIFELTVTDDKGTTGTDTVEITVTPPEDVEPPKITGITDIYTTTDAGVNTASVSLTASVGDNSGEVITPSFFVDDKAIPNPHVFPVGETVVKAVAEDSAGNKAEYIYSVFVIDTTPPEEPDASGVKTPDGKASVSGTAEPGSTITVTFPDETRLSMIADPSTGAFSVMSATPQKSGEITVMTRDAAGNQSPLASFQFAGDDTSPTITIDPLTGPVDGKYAAVITLSEESDDFTVGDLTLVNIDSAILSGSGTSYSVILTPEGDGEIKLLVAESTFTDLAGNANTVSNKVSITHDGTPPTIEITGAPDDLSAATTFTVDITFSEPVSGFEISDIVVSNANITNLTGSEAAYSATVVGSGLGDISIAIPANSAADDAGNGNLASNTVNVADITVERTQTLIAGYMQTRANQLVGNQPDLHGFLSGTTGRNFDLIATRGRGHFNFASDPEQMIWMRFSGSWMSDGTSKSRYAFGAIGSHQAINKNLLVGTMVQFDYLEEDTGGASVSGTGWMVGPYVVAKAPSQPLYFEGRLLYGQTHNDISPFGTYQDSFDTTRMLAQLKVAGKLEYGLTTLSPFLDASYTSDDQRSYIDSLGNAIPGQSVELGQIEIGLDFSRMFDVRSGTFEIWGGASSIWSKTSGSGFASTVTPDYEGGRARVELGINHTLSANRSFSASTFYDGIGTDGFESYGLSFGYEMSF